MAFNITQPPRFLFVCLFISLCYSFNCSRLLPITLPLVPPRSTLSPPSNTPVPPPTTQKKKEITWNGCVIILTSSTHLPRTCWSAQCKYSWYELHYLWFRFLFFYYYYYYYYSKIEHSADWDWVRELEFNSLCFVARQLRTPTWYTATIDATRDSPALRMDSAVHWMRIPTNF